MLIKDINKIKIKKSLMGATCPHCGGDLIPAPFRVVAGKIVSILTLGLLHSYPYKCVNCKRRYSLI